MRKSLAVLGALTALAGCSSAPPATSPPQSQASPAAAAPPVRAEAPPAATLPAPAATPRHDQCGAYEVQNLVGRPRSEIPVPVDPSRQRVACTTCPVTQDDSPTRLDFFFDAETGIIKQIRCG
ncbi:lipoprotein [Phenylobacterium hankyongense]|uniref:lipoprotein n=1 Tax=Phenylobacterium hankyongense TaxID=1813876 RepID=UPI0014032A45|nr:lipoprotein [Phenylobacterium hankyongense]